MKYGSLEWAQDLLNSTKAELDKINAADEKGKAAAEGLGLTGYYTGLVKALEDEIAKGNYVTEKDMPAKDISDDEDLEEVKTNSLIEDIYTEAKNQWNAMPLNTQDYLVRYPDKVDDIISQLKVSKNVTKAMKDIFNDKLEDLAKQETITKAIVTDVDVDGDGDVDKVETTKINPNILGGVKEFGN